jgi:hypothetical protein
MTQSRRTLQEFRTTIAPAEVLTRAKTFFTRHNSLYATFLDTEGANHVTFRGQGTEEIVVAAIVRDGATLVTASAYMFDMQISRFFTTLPEYEATSLISAETAPKQVTA